MNDVACGRVVAGNGLCDPHYRQAQQGRTPGKIRTVRYRNATLARNADGDKECVYCGQWKPESAFHKGRATSDGLQIFCAACGDAKRAKRIENDPDLRRRSHILYRYGITLADYDRLLAEQGGRCAICRTDKPARTGFHVDHDHSCHPRNQGCPKCVRGLLCHHCNTALGHLKDDPAIFRAAIAYLERAAVEDTGARH